MTIFTFTQQFRIPQVKAFRDFAIGDMLASYNDDGTIRHGGIKVDYRTIRWTTPSGAPHVYRVVNRNQLYAIPARATIALEF